MTDNKQTDSAMIRRLWIRRKRDDILFSRTYQRLRYNGWLPFISIYGAATVIFAFVVWLNRSQADDTE